MDRLAVFIGAIDADCRVLAGMVVTRLGEVQPRMENVPRKILMDEVDETGTRESLLQVRISCVPP